MSANCPSLAIANWPISALIARTFRALQPVTIRADSPRPADERITPALLRALSYPQGQAAFHCAGKRATSVVMTATKSFSDTVHVVGAGLAGSEAAWQGARSGIPVILPEMRPGRMTEAHRTDGLAELVCSNSFRSDDAANNAVGLLHAEMRRLGSLVMRAAAATQLPAGGVWGGVRAGFR